VLYPNALQVRRAESENDMPRDVWIEAKLKNADPVVCTVTATSEVGLHLIIDSIATRAFMPYKYLSRKYQQAHHPEIGESISGVIVNWPDGRDPIISAASVPDYTDTVVRDLVDNKTSVKATIVSQYVGESKVNYVLKINETDIPAYLFYPCMPPEYISNMTIGTEVEIQLVNKYCDAILTETAKFWQLAKDAYKQKTPVMVKVDNYIHEGFFVFFYDKALSGFLPKSKLGIPPSYLRNGVITELEVKIVEMKVGGTIVVSSLGSADKLLKEINQKKVATLSVGDCVPGTILRVLDYGILVDLGGARGLVHRDTLNLPPSEDLKKYYTHSTPIDVIITKIKETRLSLADSSNNNLEFTTDQTTLATDALSVNSDTSDT